MKKRTRIILFIALILVVGVIAVVSSRGGFSVGGEGSSGDKQEKEDDRFAPAERGDIELTIKATGLVEPKTRVRIKSEASGKIEELFIIEGQDLIPGDVIAILDQTTQRINLKRAQLTERLRYAQLQQLKNGSNESRLVSLRSTVETAKLALSQAEDYLARIEELFEKEYATLQEYEDAKKRVDDARVVLAQADRQLAIQVEDVSPEEIKAAELSWRLALVDLELARKNVGDATITCPIRGTVLAKFVEVGDTVVSSTSAFGEGTTICDIADLTQVQIRASVDEIDIGRVEAGQTVEVEVDAFPLEVFAGKVANIFQQGTSSGGITSFTVIVEVDNADRRLLSAMTTTLEIIADTVEDVVFVPYDVVRTDDELGTIVYVKGEDAKGRVKPEKREVKLGVTDYMNTEIIEGIDEGELVMVEDVPQSTSMRFGEVRIED